MRINKHTLRDLVEYVFEPPSSHDPGVVHEMNGLIMTECFSYIHPESKAIEETTPTTEGTAMQS